MLLYIGNGDEIGSTIVIAKLQVPLRSLETTGATVNLAQPFERRDRDLVGRETYDWAVALMCGEDASGLITCAALPPYPCGKKGSAGVAGGEFGERGDKGGVEHETVEDVDEDESCSEYGVKGHGEKFESLWYVVSEQMFCTEAFLGEARSRIRERKIFFNSCCEIE